ncbi:MAG: hypothetical protein AB7P76_02625 [Candidatus Melainabacteria bacterium]
MTLRTAQSIASLMLAALLIAATGGSVFAKATAKAAGADAKKTTAPAPGKTLTGKATAAATPTTLATADAWQKLKPETRKELETLAGKLQEESRIVFNELRDDEETSVSDIGMLWQAAVERSGSIRYAIEKLSRRDSTGEPVSSDGLMKKVLHSTASLAGLAGTVVTGSPASMMGSNMLDTLLADDPTQSALSKVTDADMIILAKEVELLQSRLIESYYGYQHAQRRWQLTQDATHALNQFAGNAAKGKTAAPGTDAATLETIMASMIQSASQDEAQAKQGYISARTELGLLVGPDALKALETKATSASNN